MWYTYSKLGEANRNNNKMIRIKSEQCYSVTYCNKKWQNWIDERHFKHMYTCTWTITCPWPDKHYFIIICQWSLNFNQSIFWFSCHQFCPHTHASPNKWDKRLCVDIFFFFFHFSPTCLQTNDECYAKSLPVMPTNAYNSNFKWTSFHTNA